MASLALIWTLAGSGTALGQDGPVLTLADAMTLARANNRTVQIRKLDVTRAGQNLADVKARRLPQFDTYIRGGMSLRPIEFTIPASALGVYPATGPIPASDATVETPRALTGVVLFTASQPLTQLFKIGVAVHQSEVAREGATVQQRAAEAAAVEEVRTRYYQIVQTEAQVAAATAGVQYLTELAGLMERRLAERAVLRGDSLTVQAKLAQQKYQVLALTDAIASAKEALNQLLGRSLDTAFTLEPLAAAALPDLEIAGAVKEAIANRPELQAARLQHTSASLDVDRARAERLPDISAQLSYVTFPNVSFVPQNLISAGVMVQWQPFDWGQRRRQIAQARVAANQAKLAMDDAEQQVAVEVRSLYRKLQEDRALVEAQAAVRESEREKLRVLTTRYEEHAALLSDLLQQQAATAQAEGEYQKAVAGLWIDRANFDRALGRE
jgi:outer membrane protein TolC